MQGLGEDIARAVVVVIWGSAIGGVLAGAVVALLWVYLA